MSTTFHSLEKCLQFIAGRQDYLINVCEQTKPGPREFCFQIVSSHFVFGDRKIRPTLYLTFDDNESGHLRFLEMQGREHFTEVEFEGVPCYALNSDDFLTEKLVDTILSHVYGVKDPAKVEYVEENL